MVATYTSSANLRFSVISVKNGTSNDLYMRVQAPVSNGWGAAGIGDQMAGAMIFLTYPSANGKDSTLSVRHAVTQAEPVAIKNNCQTQESSTTSSFIDTAFVCYGLGDDPRLKNQRNADWIWAVGPGVTVDSNSVSANIIKHHQKGTFTLNMIEAQKPVSGGSGTIPIAPVVSSGSNIGSSATSSMVYPPETLIKTHAVLLGASFLFFFPLGIFLLRLHSTRLHWITQMFGFTLSVTGFIIAIVMSAQSEEFKSFTTHHQILGLVAVSLLFPQAALGFFNHRIFKKTGKKSWMSIPHLTLGRFIILLGMVNAILGFILKGNPKGAIIFGVIALVVVLAAAAVSLWAFINRDKRSAGKEGLKRSELPTSKQEQS